MENFFYNEEFYSDLQTLMDYLEVNDEESINALSDEWALDIEETALEKICTLKQNIVVDVVMEYIQNWHGDRFPEDPDKQFKQTENAIKQGIDIEKINSSLPELYYANGKKGKITKKDLLEYIS